jgi:biotin/methionine sulfoxide reductase
MPKVTEPIGDARVEFDIYADLAQRMGNKEAFTEGLSAEGWLRRIWSDTQAAGAAQGEPLPDWDSFIEGDMVTLFDPRPDHVFLAEYRTDPDLNPLPTPSGRIEIFSETLAGYGLSDCAGHAKFYPPRDLLAGAGPLYLLSGQPETRLHSQLDNGAYSLSRKIKGREPVLIHPEDAATHGIADGDVVELFNARGRCLAGARVTDDIRKGCVFLWTGAWWDPDFDAPQARDRHGNPNALTHDMRTSSLSQSPAAHSAMVDLRKLEGPVPDITVHRPPTLLPDT